MLKIMKTSHAPIACNCRQKRNHHSISSGASKIKHQITQIHSRKYLILVWIPIFIHSQNQRVTKRDRLWRPKEYHIFIILTWFSIFFLIFQSKVSISLISFALCTSRNGNRCEETGNWVRSRAYVNNRFHKDVRI